MKVGLTILPMWDPSAAPLGVAYVSKSLRLAGHEVRVRDMNNETWHRHLEQKAEGAPDFWQGGYTLDWETGPEFRQRILPHVRVQLNWAARELFAWADREGIEALGFSVFSTNKLATAYVCARLRTLAPELKLFVGGVDMFQLPWRAQVEAGLVDACIVGEGEVTAPAYISALARGDRDSVIPGVLRMGTDGRLLPFQPRPLIDLKTIPQVDFEGMDLTRYRHAHIPIQMTRGCVAQCTFCDEVNFWEKFRYRPSEHIYEEMVENARAQGMRHFLVMDSLINGHHANFRKLADMLIAGNHGLSFGGNSRVDKRLTLELLRTYKLAGCDHLTFGLESGSQRVLDLMKKGIRLEWAKDNFRACLEVGIDVSVNLIVGFPGEEEEDFLMTMDFLREHAPYIRHVNSGLGMSIPPDTDVFHRPSKYGVRTNPDGSIYYGPLGWETVDGRNNEEVRQERLGRVRSLLRELAVPYTPVT